MHFFLIRALVYLKDVSLPCVRTGAVVALVSLE